MPKLIQYYVALLFFLTPPSFNNFTLKFLFYSYFTPMNVSVNFFFDLFTYKGKFDETSLYIK